MGRRTRSMTNTDQHRSTAPSWICAALDPGWLYMTSASPHLDPAQPAQDTAGSRAALQHSDLFLQPHYTVDLPPLDEEEDTFSPPPPPPAQKRRGAPRGR
jgi:hypothetical protein